LLYSGLTTGSSSHRSLLLKRLLLGYVLAFTLPAAALGLTLILWQSCPTVFLLFFGAVSIVAWQGLWPGMIAALESAALADYYLMPPKHAWVHDPHTLLMIWIFLLCCALISWLGDRQGRALRLYHRMTAKLAEEHNRLKLALSAADAFAWQCDVTADSRLHSDNGEALKILQYALFQKKSPGTVHPEDEKKLNRILLQQIREPASFQVEYRLLGAETRWFRTNGQAVTRSAEKPRRMVGVTFDITKAKQAEEALRNSERLATAGQLAATIAHEINNPLESIGSLVHLVQRTEGMPVEAAEYLDLIKGEVERLADISRYTLGLYKESRTPVNVALGDALNVILSLYRKKAYKKKAQLNTAWNNNLRFCGAVGELKQIVANLVSNAVDASHEGGTIVVRARESVRGDLPGILITVADDGSGISVKNRKRVFNPFFTTKEEKGTGLGLWVTQDLVARVGGDIRLKTAVTGPHRGTTFTVFLPTTSDVEHAVAV
jgi:signal transduction histidine kinase